MKNLKISAKLMVGFGIVIVLLLTTAATGLTYLSRSSNNIDYLAEHTLPDTNTVWQIRRDFVSAQRNLYKAVASNDDGEIKAFLDEAESDSESLYKSLDTLSMDYRGDMNELDAARDALQKTGEQRRAATEYILKNNDEDNSRAMAILNGEYNTFSKQAEGYLMNAANGIGSRSTDKIAKANTESSFAVVLVIIVSVTALIFAIAIAVYISRSISRPMAEIEKATKEMAEGSLHVSIDYESKDEIGSLAQSMRILCNGIDAIIEDIGRILASLADGDFLVTSRCLENYIGDYMPILTGMRLIRDNLSAALSQISQASDQVSAGSDQVSSGAQALSQGATQQASSVEELAATMNEISNQVKETAESATEALKKTAQAGEEVTTCNKQMETMIGAMAEISHKSGEINKIIKTIEDIAFQTNILALNAAVEAARAGAAGKGFAVVADEVRNLASKSAEASKNTSALIASTIEAVENGTQIASETAGTLLGVVDGAQSVAVIVDKIARDASIQASSVTQVTQGIDQISSVVQTNSATAEESAAASEELSGQAQMLKNLVGKFKLKESDIAQPQPQAQAHIQTAPDFAPVNLHTGKY